MSHYHIIDYRVVCLFLIVFSLYFAVDNSTRKVAYIIQNVCTAGECIARRRGRGVMQAINVKKRSKSIFKNVKNVKTSHEKIFLKRL